MPVKVVILRCWQCGGESESCAAPMGEPVIDSLLLFFICGLKKKKREEVLKLLIILVVIYGIHLPHLLGIFYT